MKYYCQVEGCKNEICLSNFYYGKGMCKECYKEYKKIPENNPNYKDGKSLLKYFCSECGVEISWRAGVYGGGKCIVCSQKGKKISKESIQKRSLTMKKFYKTEKGKQLIKKMKACSGDKNHNFGKHGLAREKNPSYKYDISKEEIEYYYIEQNFFKN